MNGGQAICKIEKWRTKIQASSAFRSRKDESLAAHLRKLSSASSMVNSRKVKLQNNAHVTSRITIEFKFSQLTIRSLCRSDTFNDI